MNTQAQAATPALVVRRIINASRERVFQAWTNPEMMKDWFYCGVGRAEVTNELKVGGKFRNDMIIESGGCGASVTSKVHPHTGEYLEIVPPERLVFTWRSEIVKSSRVTVEFRERDGGTEVIITHDELQTEELRAQHSHGWEGCLDNLGGYFANPKVV